jgi:3-hydroxyisobutyryl-CoA hydrolase
MDALEKDGTPFAINAIRAIEKRSPTCTVINVENFIKASEMTYMEVMERDLTLWFRVAVSTYSMPLTK